MVSPLRIATFNAENLGSAPEAAARAAVLRPQLQRLRADVLCLQEINAEETTRHGPRLLSGLDRLLEGTPYAGFHRVVSSGKGADRPADRHNLVILSRLPVLERRQLRHDLVPVPGHVPLGGAGAVPLALEWERPILHAVLQVPGGSRLHIFNLHLRAPRAAWLPGQKLAQGCGWRSMGGWAEGFYMAAIKQSGQALELRLALEAVFDSEPEALVAVAGDFNAEEREAPLRIVRGDEDDTGNGLLAARSLVSLERSLPESCRFSAIHHGRRVMLDHILVSRPLLGWYRGTEIHNEALGDEAVSPSCVADAPDSYHAPMVAEFMPVPP